jgi:Flp pilus assembly pilin Flp
MKDLMLSFWKDESGQDMADYALLLAIVAIALIAAFTLYRGAIQARFTGAARTLHFSRN